MVKTRVFICIAFFSITSTKAIHAEIEYTKLKGMHELLNSDHKFLSPLAGFTYFKQGILENMRLFGNYGPANPDFPCLPNAPDGVKKRLQDKDCPADFTASLIQQLFPSPGGDNFTPNSYPSDPVSKLTPAVLAKIMNVIAEVKPDDLTDPTKRNTLYQTLSELILNSLDPSGTKSKIKQLVDEKKGKLVTLKQLSQGSQPCTLVQSKKLHELAERIASIDTEIPTLEARHEKIKANKIKPGDIQPFLNALIGSLKESTVPPPSYPAHNAHSALLAFLWAKAGKKEDILDYFKHLDPHLLSDKGRAVVHDPTAQIRFLTESFPPIRNTKSLYGPIHKDPAFAIAFGYAQKLDVGINPTELNSGQTHFTLPQGKTIEFSDCGETSLRNVFNAFLYDSQTQTFDSSRLENLMKSHDSQITINPALIAFYQKYPSQGQAATTEARLAWTQLVSNLSANTTDDSLKIKYRKPANAAICEIDAGLENMTKVIDHLLISTNPNSKKWTTEDKLTHLTQLFSTDDRKYTWEYPQIHFPEPTLSTTINFALNGKPSFSWEFTGVHFAFRNLDIKDEGEIKGKTMALVFPELTPEPRRVNPFHDEPYWEEPHAPGNHKLPLSATWFTSRTNLARLTNTVSPLEYIKVMYSLPLKYPDTMADVIASALAAYPNDPAVLHVCKILIAKLPEDSQLHEKVMTAAKLANIPFEQILSQPPRPLQQALLAVFAAKDHQHDDFNKLFHLDMLDDMSPSNISTVLHYLFETKNLKLIESIALKNPTLRNAAVAVGLKKFYEKPEGADSKPILKDFIKHLMLKIDDPKALFKITGELGSTVGEFLSNTPVHNTVLAQIAIKMNLYPQFIKAIEQGVLVNLKIPTNHHEPATLFQFSIDARQWKMVLFMLQKYPDVLTPEQIHLIVNSKPRESIPLQEWTQLITYIHKRNLNKPPAAD
jgi:hypothetical protein